MVQHKKHLFCSLLKKSLMQQNTKIKLNGREFAKNAMAMTMAMYPTMLTEYSINKLLYYIESSFKYG
jgi:hypothetical protein